MLVDVEETSLPVIQVMKSERLHNSGSSLGNQIKWKHNNMIIKLNCLGYENVAEVLVSHLLSFTDLKKEDYVKYFSCLIYEDGKKIGKGCFSYDFVKKSIEVTIADLLDTGAQSYAISYIDLRDYLYDIVGFDVKSYIDTILCVDSITRNEDRHFKNIAFLYKEGNYHPAPIFDNGASCMSDLISYPMDVDFDVNYRNILSKPFYTDFSRNLNNNKLLKIRYNDFFASINASTENSIRALRTIKQGLAETEGLAWERC